MMSTSSKTSACSAVRVKANWSVSAVASAMLPGVAMPRSSKNIARVSWAV